MVFPQRRQTPRPDAAGQRGATGSRTCVAAGCWLGGLSSRTSGKAKKVTIDKDNTTIVEGDGTQGAIEGRVKQIRTQVVPAPRHARGGLSAAEGLAAEWVGCTKSGA
ncbi:MAG: hypothetical protein FJW21_07605 [Acidimicrobiia bacterium]|nr:hypothetical protein [Acidimicrobiia bacterium]